MDICEHLPMQAQIADKFAIIRNMRFRQQGHTSPELYTGSLTGNRPSIGSIVSKLRRDAGIVGNMPPFVSMGDGNHVPGPGFLGKPYETYQPGPRAANLGLVNGVTREQLDDRRALLGAFDSMRRDLDRGSLAAWMRSTRRRSRWSRATAPRRLRHQPRAGACPQLVWPRHRLLAGAPIGRSRRSVVTLTPDNYPVPRDCNGQWTITTISSPACVRSCRRTIGRSMHCSPTCTSAASIRMSPS